MVPGIGSGRPPRAPFGEYAEGWLKQRGIKDRTRAHYRKLLDNHILATFADTDLRDITPAAVRRWYATTAVGTPTMRAHSYSLLRAIMQTALADDLIDSNPAASQARPPPAASTRSGPPPSTSWKPSPKPCPTPTRRSC